MRNSDGLQGDASLVSDLDKETFQTMFSLTSDELRTLRNTTDVTAKLLTAGSGTGASTAHALAAVQEKLTEYTSRAAGVEPVSYTHLQVGAVFALGLDLVHASVDEHDDVGVLLDGAGLAQVGERCV